MTLTEAGPVTLAPLSAAERGQQIWILLIDLARALTDAVTARLGSEDLANNNEGWIICRLALSGPQRPRDLLSASGLSSGGMTRLLDRLEHLGVVERAVREVPADRRAIVISLTPEGQRVATAMGQGVEDTRDRIRTTVVEMAALVGPMRSAIAPEDRELHPTDAIARGQQVLLGLIELGRDCGGAIAARMGSRVHVNNADVAVICRLALSGPQRPRDLLSASGLSSGGMTRLLDRLEHLGVVERAVREVPADRRAIVISLTPEGQRVATAMGQGVEDTRDRIRTTVVEMAALVDVRRA